MFLGEAVARALPQPYLPRNRVTRSDRLHPWG
jgi:hypothetical protein